MEYVHDLKWSPIVYLKYVYMLQAQQGKMRVYKMRGFLSIFKFAQKAEIYT